MQEARRRKEEMRRVREAKERAALQRRQEMERVQLEARRLAKQVRVERQWAEEEHQRQVALINEQLVAAALQQPRAAAKAQLSSSAQRMAMEQQINQLQLSQ